MIQAKNWKNKVSIGQVLQFHKVLEDLPGQPRGIIVTTKGFQSGALSYATEHGIELFEIVPADSRIGPVIKLVGLRDFRGNVSIMEIVYRDQFGEHSIGAEPDLLDRDMVTIRDSEVEHEVTLEQERQRFRNALVDYCYDVARDGVPFQLEYRKVYHEKSTIRFPGGIASELMSISFSASLTGKTNETQVPLSETFEYYARSLTTPGSPYYYRTGTASLLSDMGMCDFCPTVMDRNDGTAFYADVITLSGPDGSTIGYRDPWGACTDCAELVLANRPDALLRRAIVLSKQRGESDAMAAAAKFSHDAFWDAYTGNYEPVAVARPKRDRRVDERRANSGKHGSFIF